MSTDNSMVKTCARCGESKPLTDFYKHPTKPGEVNYRCKRCTRAATMESRAKKRDEHLANQRIKQRNFGTEIRSRRAEQNAVYRAEHPDRQAAVTTLNLAVRLGKLQRLPCFVCGAKAEGHHPDYSRPLDVVWLCPAHHREAHALVTRPGPKPQIPI